MKNFVFLSISLLLWSCAPQAKIDLAAEKADLLATAEAYQEACGVMDVEKILSFYTTTAKAIPPEGEVVSGTAAIQNFLAGIKELKNFTARFEQPEVEIAAGGDMGYSLAPGVLSFEDANGKMIEESLRDFHVWVKVDNQWKLAIDIWNAPPPKDTVGE